MCIPPRYWNVTWEEISNGDHREIVENYLRKLPDMFERGVGLLLWGANGCGKTSAAVIVGKEYRRRGQTVLFFEAAALKRAVIQREMFDEDQDVWERARDVDVLILDDLGKGVQDKTGFGARLLDELIRHRNAHERVTFITTNMSPFPQRDGEISQLEDELKISTLHSLKECIVPVCVDGPDLRDKTKDELRELLRN